MVSKLRIIWKQIALSDEKRRRKEAERGAKAAREACHELRAQLDAERASNAQMQRELALALSQLAAVTTRGEAKKTRGTGTFAYNP